jgi:hypothetical protein
MFGSLFVLKVDISESRAFANSAPCFQIEKLLVAGCRLEKPSVQTLGMNEIA